MCDKQRALKVYAAGETPKRFIGYVTIRAGIVAPGKFAAVRAPDGDLIIRRIYYYREDEQELVRLVSVRRRVAAICHPLAQVTIMGEIACACMGAKRKRGVR
jgi:hypothetical protein